MIPLQDKTNVIAPNGTFPFGNVKNNPGDDSGTPVDVSLVGDSMIFFEMLSQFPISPSGTPANAANYASGVSSPNGQQDNGSTFYQLFSAFFANIGLMVKSFIADQTTVNAGTDDVNYVTSLKLKTLLAIRPSWTVVASFLNSWASSSPVLKYSKDLLGVVHIDGNTTNSSSGNNATAVFVLPVGYRPQQDVQVIISANQNGSSTYAYLQIDTSGNVTVTIVGWASGTGGAYISFSFPTW